jgi:hydrogenase maturation protease
VRIRVIGVGTRAGDDAAGLAVAERLQDRGLLQARIARCERPVELIELVAGADAAVVADAVRSGAAPGTLHHLHSSQLLRGAGVSSHALGVADALALLSALGRLPLRLHIVGIEAGDATSGELSGPVARAVHRAALWIESHVRALAAGAARTG